MSSDGRGRVKRTPGITPVRPYLEDADFTLYNCDVLEGLAQLEDESAHCVVTSPPYWSLRDYGVDGQLGHEPTPDEYVGALVAVFREVRRVLRRDGTCWLNLGDSYASTGGHSDTEFADRRGQYRIGTRAGAHRAPAAGIKQKDLVGIPWRVALALQADGWWLRSDIVWHKPSTMPESALDRPTGVHEYVFLLAKRPSYFFDWFAVREPAVSLDPTHPSYRPNSARIADNGRKTFDAKHASARVYGSHRLVRSVWTIPSAAYGDAHFAVFPPELAERCISAGTSERGCCANCGAPYKRVVDKQKVRRVDLPAGHPDHRPETYEGKYALIYRENPGQAFLEAQHAGWRAGCECGAGVVPAVALDPFMGSGTVAFVARRLGRHSIGVELNPDYCALIARRTQQLSLEAEATA